MTTLLAIVNQGCDAERQYDDACQGEMTDQQEAYLVPLLDELSRKSKEAVRVAALIPSTTMSEFLAKVKLLAMATRDDGSSLPGASDQVQLARTILAEAELARLKLLRDVE